MKLTDAMNTYNSALLAIKSKGFDITLMPHDNDDELGSWCAKMNGHEFIASDPLRLLGLISIWEIRGNKWERQPKESDLYDKILDDVFEDDE